MKIDELPIALLGFVAFVVVAPAMTRYASGFEAAQPEGQFIAGLVLPAAAMLFLTSWVKPELSGFVLGGLVLVSVVLLAPWFCELTGLVTGTLVDDPLASFVLRLAVPALVLSFLVTLGQRRIRGSGGGPR
jgi:hypothetical protein